MNKIFKVVWSKSKQCYVVVSEMAKNNSGKKRVLASVLAALAVVSAGGVGSSVQAATDLGNSSVNISPNGAYNGSNHVGSNSIVVGYQNTTDNNWGTVAIGAANTATENSAVAVGNGNEATGGASAAFGAYNKAKGRASVAIGNVSMASGDDSIAIGNRANSNPANQDRGSGQFSIAMGRESWARGTDNISIGHNAVTDSSGDSIAIGRDSTTNSVNTVTIGAQTKATGGYAVAIGRESEVNANFATAMGYQSKAKGSASIAIGKQNNSNLGDTITMGNSNTANTMGGIAIGKNNIADSSIGDPTTATKENSQIAIGRDNKATSMDTVAIGREAESTKTGAVSLGARTKAKGDYAVALGSASENKTVEAADYAVAVGAMSKATGERSVAVGGGAEASAARAVANGYRSSASVEDGVALGSYSKATVDKGIQGFNPATGRTNKYSDQAGAVGTSTLAAVSVGDGANATRQITGLAAGTEDTDAVNVAQLKNVNLKFAGNSGNGDVLLKDGTLNVKGEGLISTSADNDGIKVKLTQGGPITADNTGKAKEPTNNGVATTQNVVQAINNSGWNATAGSEDGGTHTGNPVSAIVKPGNTVAFVAGKNLNVEQRVGSASTGGDQEYIYSLNKDVDLTKDGSLTIGDTKIVNDGLTITGGPSITKTGINAGNKTITNVSDGVNNNDAVNVSQLKAVAAKERHIKPGSYAVDNDGNVTMTYVDGDGKDVAGDKAIITGVANQDLSNITNNGETKIKNLAKSVINMEDGKNTKASSRDVNGVKTFKVDVEGDLTGITSISNTTTGPKMEIGANSINITNGPINMGGSKIVNVAPGTDDTDAVNYSQIKGLRTEVKAGNNVNVTKTQGGDGHDIYTIDATSTGGAASSWKVNTSATDGTHSGDTTQTISDQKKVDLQAGKNLTVKQTNTTDGADVEFALNKDVDLTKDGSLTIGDTKIVNDGLTITGGPSVTKTGINAGNKTITNVSDGVNNNDAVNVSQLKAVAAKERHIKPGSYAVDNDGNVTMTYVDGDGKDVAGDKAIITGVANQDLSNITNNGETKIKNLAKSVINMEDGKNTKASSRDVNGVKTFKVDVEGDLTGITSISNTTTGPKMEIGANSINITNGPINMGGSKIVNVAPGTDDTDAVNVKQLKAAKTVVEAGSNVTVTKNTGSNGEDVYTVSASGGGTTTASSWKVNTSATDGTHSGDATQTISDQKKVELQAGKNLTVKQTNTTDGAKVEFALNKDVDLTKDGSLTIGDTKIVNDGLTITGGPSITKTGINAGNKTITNVSDGVNNNDAVNVSQLKAVAAKERHIKPGSYAVDTDGNVTMTYVDGDGNNIAGDKAIITGVAKQDLSNINNAGKNVITGLGTIVKAGDNVNVSESSDATTGQKTYTVNAVTPAVYTKADGTKVVKRPNGTFTTNLDGSAGNDVDGADVIASFMDGNGNTTGGNMVINNVGSAIDKTGTSTGDAFLTKLNTAATNTPNAAVNVKDLKTTSDALVDKGLNFTGNNTGTENAHKLGSLVKVQGEGLAATDVPTFASAAGNIAVVANGTDTLELKLNKNLKGINSVNNGNTSILLNDAPNTTTPAVTIKGGNLSLGDGTTNNKIVNLAPGTDDNDAVNVKQLKAAKTVVAAGSNVTVNKTTGSNGEDVYTVSATGGGTTTASSWNVKSTGNTDSTSEPAAKTISNGNTVEMAAGKNLTVKQTSDANGAKVEFALNKDLSNLDKVVVNGKDGVNGHDGVTIIGPQGAAGATGIPGTNGIDGKVGISGKDGKDAVSIAGKDGVGTIGLTGPQGPAGADGKGVDISTDHGTQTLVKQEANNDNKSERIVYVPKDKDGNPLKDGDGNTIKREVATMDDGLKFKGDNATVIKKPLGEQLDIIGGATGSLSDNNIGVNEDNGKLKVQLAKTIDLTKDGSVTTGNTKVDNGGVTITAPTGGTTTNVSLTQSGLDNGGNKIVNVKEGTADTDAVNVKQLKDAKTVLVDGKNTKKEGSGTAADPYKVNVEGALVDISSITNGSGSGKLSFGPNQTVTVDGDHSITLNAKTGKIGGLQNKTFDPNNFTSGQAATEDQLKSVHDTLKASELHIAPTTGTTEDKGGTASGSTNVYKYDATNKTVTLTYNDGNGQAVSGPKAVIDFSALNVTPGNNYGFNTNAGGNLATGTTANVKPVASGKTVTYAAGKNLTVEQKETNGDLTYTYALDKDLTNLDKIVVNGKDGQPGHDGVTITGPQGTAGVDGNNGKVGISGKDGKDAVSISGKDGVGHIGLTGPAGKDGKDATADITVKDGVPGVDGAPGDSMTRIVYKDKDGKDHEVATHDDGMKFAGDNGQTNQDTNPNVIKKHLNNVVDIIGGATGTLTDNNIGVNADNGKLKVQLAKDINLTKDGSLTIGGTKVDGNGLTITGGPSVTKTGIDAGNKAITNVANGTNDSDAVNVSQLKGSITTVKSSDGSITVTDANAGSTDPTKGHAYDIKVNNQGVVNNAQLPVEYTKADGTKVYKQPNGTFNTAKDGSGDVVNAGDVIASMNNGSDSTTTPMKLANVGSSIAGQSGSTYLDKINAAASNPNTTNNAVNVSDLKDTAKAIGDKGLNFGAQSGTDIHKNLGEKLEIVGGGQKADSEYDASNIKTMTKDGKVVVALDKNIKADTVTVGKDGKDGVDGKIGVNGKDGASVTINGKDGSIGLQGPKGADGKDGASATIKVKDGVPGVDGKDGETLTRIVYETKDGVEHQVATHDDGLKFTGNNTSTVNKHHLNSLVKVQGEGVTEAQSTSFQSAAGNINVKANGTDTLEVQLNKDLKGINSIRNSATGPAMTFNTGDIAISGGNLNMGDNKITNVGPGTDGTDAVNLNQLKAARTVVTSKDGSVTVTPNENQATHEMTYDLKVNGAHDPRVDQLNEEIGRVGAQGAALAALKPIQYDPLEPTQIMAGYGNYRGNSALAVGVAHYKNESTMLHAGMSWAGGSSHMMANAGVTWKFGNRDAENAIADRYRKGPISAAYALQNEMAAVKAQNAGLKSEVSDLKAENQQMKAQIAAMMAKLGL